MTLVADGQQLDTSLQIQAHCQDGGTADITSDTDSSDASPLHTSTWLWSAATDTLAAAMMCRDKLQQDACSF